jgi:hypothetical protein
MFYVEMGPECSYMEKAQKTIDMASGVHRNPTTFDQLMGAFREGNVVGAYALLNMDLSHRELSEIIDNLVGKARKNDWKAVHAIAEYGKRASRPDVIESLKHAALFGDDRMSRHARRALAKLGVEAESQSVRAGIEKRLRADYKRRALKEDDLAETAAKTLGAFVTVDNADEIIPKLCNMAREGNECAAVTLGACAAFSGRKREVLLTLVEMVLTGEGDAVWDAMEAVKQIGPDGAWSHEIVDVVLGKLFADRDGSRPLLALLRIGPHVSSMPGVTDALVKIVKTGNKERMELALNVFSAIGELAADDPMVVEAILARAAEGVDDAVTALGHLGKKLAHNSQVVEALLKLSKSSDIEIKRSALQSLSDIGKKDTDEFVDGVLSLFEDADLLAASALPNIGEPVWRRQNSLQRLLRLAEKGNISAIRIIGRFGAKVGDNPQIPLLLERLAIQGNSDAIFAIADTGEKALTPQILNYLKRKIQIESENASIVGLAAKRLQESRIRLFDGIDSWLSLETGRLGEGKRPS